MASTAITNVATADSTKAALDVSWIVQLELCANSHRAELDAKRQGLLWGISCCSDALVAFRGSLLSVRFDGMSR